MNNFEEIYRQNSLIDIAPKYCFEVTLSDFVQIIKNDFIQLKAE